MATRDINLRNYKPSNGNSFSGRAQGKSAREELKLDVLDLNDDIFTFIIPKETTSFNPSFFLGLFFPSIERLGIDEFKSKYKFTYETTDEEAKRALRNNIRDGFRNAANTLDNKNALSFFN